MLIILIKLETHELFNKNKKRIAMIYQAIWVNPCSCRCREARDHIKCKTATCQPRDKQGYISKAKTIMKKNCLAYRKIEQTLKKMLPQDLLFNKAETPGAISEDDDYSPLIVHKVLSKSLYFGIMILSRLFSIIF